MSEKIETPVTTSENVAPVTENNLQPPHSIEENGKAVSADSKVDSSTENKTDAVQKKDPVAAKFAALSREKKEILKQQAELKTSQEKLQSLQKAHDDYKNDPVKLLEAYGYNVDTFLEQVVKGKVPETVIQKQEKTEAEKRLERVEQELENNKKAQAQKEFDQQLTTFKQGVTDMVKAKSVDLELLNDVEDPAQTVFEYIVAIKNQSGEELSPEKAAAEIEDYLQKTEEARIEKLSKLNKFKDKFAKEPVKAPNSDKKDEPTVKGSKTLSADIPLAPTTSGRKLTYQEELMETINHHLKAKK